MGQALFRLVQDTNVNEFEKKITRRMKKGYFMHGQPFVYLNSSAQPVYCQAMVLPDEDAPGAIRPQHKLFGGK